MWTPNTHQLRTPSALVQKKILADSNGQLLATVYCGLNKDGSLDRSTEPVAQATAAFIVQACNAHEELLNTLKIVAKDCRMALDGTWDKIDEGFEDTLEFVEAAIAKAEGK